MNILGAVRRFLEKYGESLETVVFVVEDANIVSTLVLWRVQMNWFVSFFVNFIFFNAPEGYI